METSATHTEQELLTDLHNGSEAAFTQVYRQYFERVLVYARRIVNEEDAQDITADTFLQLWRKRSEFSHFGGIVQFLFLTARNGCYDRLRRLEVRSKHAAHLADLMDNDTQDFFVDQVRIEFVKLIEEQVQQLPERMREVFLLSFRDGLKPAQVAEQLGIHVKTVSNQKLSAVKLLRAALKDHPLEMLITLLVQLDKLT